MTNEPSFKFDEVDEELDGNDIYDSDDDDERQKIIEIITPIKKTKEITNPIDEL
jgi:hypothetical protein